MLPNKRVPTVDRFLLFFQRVSRETRRDARLPNQITAGVPGAGRA